MCTEYDIMHTIEVFTGAPKLTQRLHINGRSFWHSDQIEDGFLDEVLHSGSSPKIFLEQLDLHDMMSECTRQRARPGLLLAEAFENTREKNRWRETANLISAGYFDAALSFLERDVEDLHCEEDVYDRDHVLDALLGMLELGSKAAQITGRHNPVAKRFQAADGVKRLQALPDASKLADQILSQFFDIHVPSPVPDYFFVSVENGGSWNPGRYGIMPDECM